MGNTLSGTLIKSSEWASSTDTAFCMYYEKQYLSNNIQTLNIDSC